MLDLIRRLESDSSDFAKSTLPKLTEGRDAFSLAVLSSIGCQLAHVECHSRRLKTESARNTEA